MMPPAVAAMSDEGTTRVSLRLALHFSKSAKRTPLAVACRAAVMPVPSHKLDAPCVWMMRVVTANRDRLLLPTGLPLARAASTTPISAWRSTLSRSVGPVHSMASINPANSPEKKEEQPIAWKRS